jgi:DNA-binding NarL/FixJ family response regulator
MLRTSDKPIRTVIIDDHPVIRYGLREMLGADDGIDIVGELEDLDGLDALLATVDPDIVLLDLELEDTHGVEALRIVREKSPSSRIIIYTSHDEEERIVQAAELGVDGYLLKGCPRKELISAIHSVCDGGTALEASVARKLMHHMNRRSAKEEEPAVEFSKREQQVLGLMASGKTNKDIGSTLFISESTVKFHVHAILIKLDAGNRTEAVSIANQLGLIEN